MNATRKCADLAERLTGRRPEPRKLTSPRDVDRLLKEHGIEFFGGKETTRARWPAKAIAAGYGRYLIPPAKYVPRFVAIVALMDFWRGVLGFPLYAYNVYRPRKYNRKVSRASRSAHVACLAIDIDTRSRTRLQQLLEECVRPMWEAGQVPMGLGVDDTEIHVDIFAGRLWRKRPLCWPYDHGHVPHWAR